MYDGCDFLDRFSKPTNADVAASFADVAAICLDLCRVGCLLSRLIWDSLEALDDVDHLLGESALHSTEDSPVGDVLIVSESPRDSFKVRGVPFAVGSATADSGAMDLSCVTCLSVDAPQL